MIDRSTMSTLGRLKFRQKGGATEKKREAFYPKDGLSSK